MRRIAIVIHRFGEDINGGAEVHARMIAKHLIPFYDVDILTTTIKKWEDRKSDYPVGMKLEGGFNVFRFSTINYDQSLFLSLKRVSKFGRKIRKALFRMGVLKYFARFFAYSTLFKRKEMLFFEQYAAHSPSLLDYIKKNKDEYDVFIFMTYYFSNTLLGGLISPQKSILIPTAHQEKELFYALYSDLFSKVRHIAFNTNAEKVLCENIFGTYLAPSSIVATGIELKPSQKWSDVRRKYDLPNDYVLYLGRVTYGKINTLLDDFLAFKKSTQTQTKLVLVGGVDSNIPIEINSDIIFTGFVSEEEKTAIIEHATLMINPSKVESLSLLLLEGLSKGIPVLVNGKCEVLKEHCLLSRGACDFYLSRTEFVHKLTGLLSSKENRTKMGDKGKKYVADNYSWSVVISKLTKIIDSI